MKFTLIILISILFNKNLFSQNNIDTISTKEIINYCNEIYIDTDKYTNEISFTSPISNDIIFLKYIKNNITDYYVNITTYSTYLSSDNVGLIILFKSGKKIIRNNEKVDYDVANSKYWKYSVFFRPTSNEITLLQTEEIIGVKLYIFDNEIKNGTELKGYANCMFKKPQVKKKK